MKLRPTVLVVNPPAHQDGGQLQVWLCDDRNHAKRYARELVLSTDHVSEEDMRWVSEGDNESMKIPDGTTFTVCEAWEPVC